MRINRYFLFVVSFLVLARSGTTQTTPSLTSQPLVFEPNLGQASPGVKYIASDRSRKILVSNSSIAFLIRGAKSSGGSAISHAVTLHWLGDPRATKFEPEGLQPGISNYLMGKDASKWVSKVPHYANIKETGVFPGVDVRYHACPSGDLEYDLIVAPDIDLDGVGLSVEGADKVRLCEGGALCLQAGGVELRQLAPKAYEMRDGEKVDLDVAYTLQSKNQVSFAVKGRSPGSELVIDPVISMRPTLAGVRAPIKRKGIMPSVAGRA
jgi:hypothetical protein